MHPSPSSDHCTQQEPEIPPNSQDRKQHSAKVWTQIFPAPPGPAAQWQQPAGTHSGRMDRPGGVTRWQSQKGILGAHSVKEAFKHRGSEGATKKILRYVTALV